MDRIRPLHDFVLVRVLPEDLQRDSGLLIPDNVKHPSCQGEVVACGPLVRDVKPGDWVLFDPIQENAIIPDLARPEEEYLLMPEDAVMGVLAW